MAVLRSLLELYGALDHALIRSSDPKVHEHVDNLMPGASANKGWYREIERFFFGPDAQQVPDLRSALASIATKHKDKPLAASQQSRLLFGIAAHARIRKVAQTSAPLNLDDPRLADALARALALLGPKSTPYDQRLEKVSKSHRKHIDDIGDIFVHRHNFADVCKYGTEDADFLNEDVEKVGLCQTSFVTVDGVPSVVIDTDFESQRIPLKDLKAIVDPRNWHKDYREFFLNMKAFGPRRPDDWGRVRETVGLEDDVLVRQIVTALKYHKSDDEDENTARVDYDLDDPTPSLGDGQVLVDRGFINMRAIGDPETGGVHVRTRKVVHIRGLRPYTQQRLVCVTGYATAAKDFLFGAAENPAPDAVPWDTPATDLDPEPEKGDSKDGGTQSKSVTEPTSQVAQAIANVFSDCVEDLTNQNVELWEKWTTGRLDFTDLANYSKDVSGRLISSPWEFLQSLNNPWYGPLNRKTPRTG